MLEMFDSAPARLFRVAQRMKGKAKARYESLVSLGDAMVLKHAKLVEDEV